MRRRPWLTHPFVSVRNALTAGLWSGVISDLTTFYPRTTTLGDYVSRAGWRSLVLCIGVAITIAIVVALIRSAVRHEPLPWE